MAVDVDQARSIFLAAIDESPDERPAFLNRACGDDGELRARVEHLLEAHQALGSIHFHPIPVPAVERGWAIIRRPRLGHRPVQTPRSDRRRGDGHGLHGRTGAARPA